MTRTPLRISIGGGGTDLPSYYQRFGGFVISGAITKYIYLTANRSFRHGYLLRYSVNEHVAEVSEIHNPLLRQAIEMLGVQEPLEIVSIGDVPAGTGLGPSGAFVVGLVHLLHAYKREPVTPELLARLAIEIEMVRLREPVGKQDQYIAAYGGLLCQHYHPDGTVKLEQLAMSDEALREFHDSLMLFFAGDTRQASSILREQQQRTDEADPEMLAGLHFARELGLEIRSVLEAGKVAEFGPLMHEHWLRKRARGKSMSNERVDALYEAARSRGGARGGKLVGAGGCGFLLFQTFDRRRLRECMREAGAEEMDFQFDFDGSVVHTRSA
ncbi:galactokinase [Silvibacterium sp.]|uniref:GHMP family kinase ATP-binding protein n=1 Tax=Silvibacterium sp. TaxID=1964179 RepID=UPI0039E67BB4